MFGSGNQGFQDRPVESGCESMCWENRGSTVSSGGSVSLLFQV